MEIEVRKPTPEEIETIGIRSWPVWEKGISRFPWTYDTNEECLLLSGKVTVEMLDGRRVEFGAGDFVRFPEGLKCIWHVHEPVRKHYRFG